MRVSIDTACKYAASHGIYVPGLGLCKLASPNCEVDVYIPGLGLYMLREKKSGFDFITDSINNTVGDTSIYNDLGRESLTVPQGGNMSGAFVPKSPTETSNILERKQRFIQQHQQANHRPVLTPHDSGNLESGITNARNDWKETIHDTGQFPDLFPDFSKPSPQPQPQQQSNSGVGDFNPYTYSGFTTPGSQYSTGTSLSPWTGSAERQRQKELELLEDYHWGKGAVRKQASMQQFSKGFYSPGYGIYKLGSMKTPFVPSVYVPGFGLYKMAHDKEGAFFGDGGYLWDTNMGAEGNLAGWGNMLGATGGAMVGAGAGTFFGAGAGAIPAGMAGGYVGGLAGRGILGSMGRSIDWLSGHRATQADKDQRLRNHLFSGDSAMNAAFGAIPGVGSVVGKGIGIGGTKLVAKGVAAEGARAAKGLTPGIRSGAMQWTGDKLNRFGTGMDKMFAGGAQQEIGRLGSQATRGARMGAGARGGLNDAWGLVKSPSTYVVGGAMGLLPGNAGGGSQAGVPDYYSGGYGGGGYGNRTGGNMGSMHGTLRRW